MGTALEKAGTSGDALDLYIFGLVMYSEPDTDSHYPVKQLSKSGFLTQ